ncbi:MAG: hypothetical protein GWP63_07895 [Haliea sp.]|jgi:hypothetical protein|nr:hypothetical protein [Haliea sp.]
MANKRKDGPRSRPVYRSERIVQDGDFWFFYTREGTVHGPFDSRLKAISQLDQYIKVVTSGLLPEQELDVDTTPIERWNF